MMNKYLKTKDYLGYPIHQNGLTTFYLPDDQKYYFAFIKNGQVWLKSKGYHHAASRNRAIQLVTQLFSTKDYYQIKKNPQTHQYYAALKAKNHHKVARTTSFDSESALWAFISSCVKLNEENQKTPSTKSQIKLNDYLMSRFYNGHPRNVDFPDFSTFKKNNLYFFALLDQHHQVLLRSEGYTSTSARNKGIRAVLKNRSIERRQSILLYFGYYFVTLKAGNHQEIARSTALKNKQDALQLLKQISLYKSALP